MSVFTKLLLRWELNIFFLAGMNRFVGSAFYVYVYVCISRSSWVTRPIHCYCDNRVTAIPQCTSQPGGRPEAAHKPSGRRHTPSSFPPRSPGLSTRCSRVVGYWILGIADSGLGPTGLTMFYPIYIFGSLFTMSDTIEPLRKLSYYRTLGQGLPETDGLHMVPIHSIVTFFCLTGLPAAITILLLFPSSIEN